jgi:methyl-accepting chemotaxis protein
MTCAGTVQILGILARRLDCSRDEADRINELVFRLRSLECDVFASLYAAYIDHNARSQRELLATVFRDGIGNTLDSAASEGALLKS